MKALTFPLFLVMSRDGQLTLPLAVVPGYIATFSNAQKAAAFMDVRGDTNWQMTMIARSNFEMDVEALRKLGLKGLCLDPTKGSHDTLINFDEIEN
jgi:hypothetical protein